MTQHVEPTTRIQVWDLSIRLFHWALVAAIGYLWYSGEEGGDMTWHMYIGYTVLGLVTYRILWGLVGSHYARFKEFLRSPKATLRYALAFSKGKEPHFVGHNPLGGWMVIALLLLVATQGVTGLFTSDDIFTDGPLVHLVSSDMVSTLSSIHKQTFDFILVAVALHVLAVIYHAVVKKDPIVPAMVTGKKIVPLGTTASTLPLLRAIVIAAVAAAAIWAVVNLL